MAETTNRDLHLKIAGAACLAMAAGQLIVPHAIWFGLSAIAYSHWEGLNRKALAAGGQETRAMRFADASRWILLFVGTLTAIRMTLAMT